MEDRFVRPKEFRSMLGVSNATFWALLKARKLPAGVLMGERVRVWKMSEIQEIIDNPGALKWGKEVWSKAKIEKEAE